MSPLVTVGGARRRILDVRRELAVIAGYDIVKMSSHELRACTTDVNLLGNRVWRLAAGLGREETPNACLSRVAFSLWNLGDLVGSLVHVRDRDLAGRFAEIERLRVTVAEVYGTSLKNDLLGIDVEARRANPAARRATRIATQARLRLLEHDLRHDYWRDVLTAADQIDSRLSRLLGEQDDEARIWVELRPAPLAEHRPSNMRRSRTAGWRPAGWALEALDWSTWVIPAAQRERWSEEYQADLHHLPEGERSRWAQLRYVLRVAARTWEVRQAVLHQMPARDG